MGRGIFRTSALLLMALLAGALVTGSGGAPAQTWGNSVRDMALSISGPQTQVRLGETVSIEAIVRNFGPKDRLLVRKWRDEDYRVVLYSADGSPVPLSQMAERGANLDHSVLDTESIPNFRTLKPGEEYRTTLNVAEFCRIEKAGSYWVVVIAKADSWNRPLLISNALKIEIVR